MKGKEEPEPPAKLQAGTVGISFPPTRTVARLFSMVMAQLFRTTYCTVSTECLNGDLDLRLNQLRL